MSLCCIISKVEDIDFAHYFENGTKVKICFLRLKPSSLQMEYVSTAFEVVLDLVALYFVIFSQSKRINDIFIFWFYNKYARIYTLLTANVYRVPNEFFGNFSVNQIVSDKRAIINKQNRLASLVLIGQKFVRLRNS